LFKKAHVKDVIVGKNNYLFEKDYIKAYYGKDFIGEERARLLFEKLRKVQDTLEKQKKLIVVIFAVGKASYYPEYIPEDMLETPNQSNYRCFTELASQMRINHIDFNAWFIEQKFKSKYPLYPQFGIHWSNYGSLRAFDSIVNYIDHKSNTNLPDLKVKKITISDSLRPSDDDIIKAMNLFVQPKTFPMAYPEYEVLNDRSVHKKINLLVIGDSFWWQIYGSGLPDKVFSKNSFWFYNKEMYPESYTSPMFVFNSDYFKRINESDAIILIHSEATLKNFSNGFIEMAYESYFAPNLRSERIKQVKHQIHSSSDWFSFVKDDAKEKQISIDSALTIHALYELELRKIKEEKK
jgi:hypothetical protein